MQKIKIGNSISQKKTKNDQKVSKKCPLSIFMKQIQLTMVRFSFSLSKMPTAKESSECCKDAEKRQHIPHIPCVRGLPLIANGDFLQSHSSMERRE